MWSPYHKSVGFDELYACARLEHTEWVAHILIGSRNFNPIAGTKAWLGWSTGAAMHRPLRDQHYESFIAFCGT